jgi:glycine/sarcosine N-methyltransferase
MTDAGNSALTGVSSMYDRLAPEYDDMTGFGKRFVREKPFFRLIVERHGITTAIDAGCGTGFHSLLLAQLGVHVTAVDISGGMLDRLGRHASEMGLNIRRVRSDFGSLQGAVKGPFDAVFCMGNTLPHLLNVQEIRNTLVTFVSLLRPGGLLFLQMLNYARILSTRERVQNARERNGVTFVRFYDFDGTEDLIHFNVLRLEKNEQKITTELMTVPLLPLTAEGLLPALAQCGYEQIKMFGSVAMDPFDPASSTDLVVTAASTHMPAGGR